MKGLMRTLFVSALLLFGAVTASPAAADNPVEPMQLGLGDSWGFGFGAKVPSEGGYVAQLHEALQEDFQCVAEPDEGLRRGACPQLELINLAQGGATTPSMISNQLIPKEGEIRAIPLLESRNQNPDPRDDVELTTLHIGGNDVTNPVIGACLIRPELDCPGTIAFVLGSYAFNLNVALEALREAAGGERIVIGTYDNPIPTCFLAQLFPGEAVPLADLVLEGGTLNLRGEILVVPQGLHDIMRDVGEDHGVDVAEVYGDLRPDDWVGGNDCLHPDDTGYGKVTDAFLEVLGGGSE